MAMWKRFGSDQRGTMAVTFGLTALPVLAVAGVALDHNRAVMTRTALQSAADATALAITLANHEGRSYDVKAMVADAIKRAGVEGQIARDNGGRLRLETASTRLSADTFQVSITGAVPASFVNGLFGKVDVGVAAVATGEEKSTTARVSGANLDPEAWDYNELQSYCYDAINDMALAPLGEDGKRMSAFPKIADNTEAGVKAGPKHLNVACRGDEQPSYLLKNIREARKYPEKMVTGTPRLFYTHAVRDRTTNVLSYKVKFNGRSVNTLETILCDSMAKCQPKAKGGILPDNHTDLHRAPKVNRTACTPGQFIYLGWEDRVPGFDGDDSDEDFDDIRAVVSCPTSSKTPFQVRLQS